MAKLKFKPMDKQVKELMMEEMTRMGVKEFLKVVSGLCYCMAEEEEERTGEESPLSEIAEGINALTY